MSSENNIEIVKSFFAAASGGDRAGMLAMVTQDIEWIIPGHDWPLAGIHQGREGLERLLDTMAAGMEMAVSEPREFVSQADRVMVAGYAEGRVKATDKPFKDNWVFAITLRDGNIARIREYVDTQALALAAQSDQP